MKSHFSTKTFTKRFKYGMLYCSNHYAKKFPWEIQEPADIKLLVQVLRKQLVLCRRRWRTFCLKGLHRSYLKKLFWQNHELLHKNGSEWTHNIEMAKTRL